MNAIEITTYTPGDRDRVIALALRVWSPVFAVTRRQVPEFVYRAFYPNGWQARQMEEVGRLLDQTQHNVLLALCDGELTGFVGFRLRPAESVGEIDVLAVTPEHQRLGTGSALMEAAEGWIRKAGMAMVMVETLGDGGDAPAQQTYEALGYERWPVVRYFKAL